MKKKFTFLLIALLACLGVKAQDVVEISTVDELKAFRDAVNGGNQYAGQTVKLTADLDLSSESNWTPIGNLVSYPGQSFNGTFDGQGHTISNLTCTDNTPNHAVAGLFGSVVSGTIKNLTVKNVNLNSLHYAAGIVAYTSNTPTIENCHVIGGTIKSTPELINGSYDNGDKAGGIMGYATAGSTINNCTVQDVTISAYRDFGGIVGFSAGSVTNNTAIDVSLEQNLTHDYKSPNTPTTFDYILGRNGGATLDNNVVKNSICKIGDTKYISIADAVAAASAGVVIEIFKAGTYTLPEISKNVTIEATVDGVEVSHTSAGSVASIPNGCTFKNITFNFGNVDYHGFQHAGTINMEGCTLNGKFFSYGDMNFTNCKFNQTNADYHMWVYGPSTVRYTECTFTNTNTGKFLNVYREGGQKNTVYIDKCNFINQGSVYKAAVNVKATSGANLLTADVYITESTTEGLFPEATTTDPLVVLNNLVQVDDRTADGVDNIRVWQDNVQIYPLTYVAQYKDTKYTSLQAALDAAEAEDPADIDIVIDLLDDATLDITAWNGTKNPLSIGTVNTQTITINGNNHTLDFVQKNSDWNNVATMNDAQTKLILNDMAITNSGHNNGPWNRHDINFNCAVELNNVTSDKALALKNHATLNNVTITENNTSDTYGLWISPRVENQTINIDGLKLTASAENGTGRGIKVDDQYVTNNGGTVYKVTLNIANSTFSTEAKAAILLKAAEGVDVIDGGGNIIENVAADNVNLVWVDESRAAEYYKYSLTSTSGATMVPESKESDYVVRLSNPDGKIMGYYKGTDAIANAVAAATADGYTATIFKAGEYTMPNLPHNINVETAEGVEGAVFNHTGTDNIASIPNGATFKNLTFNFGNNDYHGFQHAGTINMEGCTLNGKLFSYGNMNFTECSFNQENEDYNMWVYGGGTVNYKDCTFTGKGKLLHLYTEDGNATHTVNVDGCTFSSSKNSKAAINVKATCGSTVLQYDLTITNSKTEGGNFPAATITQPLVVLNDLAQVDDRTETGVDNIRIWQDGVQIYPLAPVAKIGEIGYPTLQSALDAAHEMTGDVTVQLVADITEYAIARQKADLNLTIEGKEGEANHTITGQIIIDGDGRSTGTETLTIQNIAFTGNQTNFYTGSDAFILIPSTKTSGTPYYTGKYNYAHNVTISDCSFTSTSETLNVVGVKSTSGATNYNLTIQNATGRNLHSLAQLTATEGSTINNCDVEADGFVNIDGGGRTHIISNCKFVSLTEDGYAVREKGNSTAEITLTDNDFTSFKIVQFGKKDDPKGTVTIESGKYVGDIVSQDTDKSTGKIVISGGHFSAPIYDDAYADYIAEGLTGIQNLYPEDEAAPNGVAPGIVKVTETDGTVSFYNTLQAAVDAAGENAVVTPLIDLNLTTVTTTPNNKYNVSINKSITIDGEGHTITSSTGKRPFVLQGEGNNITLKDLTIVNNKADACMFIVDNLTCTLDGVTLDANKFSGSYNQPLTIGSISGNGRVTLNVTNGSVIKTNDEGSAHYSIIAWHPADITVTDSELKGWATVYIKPDAAGSTVNISNSKLTSKGLSGATNNFAMFVTESGNNEITLTDCTLNSSAVSGTYESLFILGGQDNVVKILGSTTYTTNDETYGPITYDWGSLKTNKMYFDDTTKAAFDKYFDEANGCYILDEKEQPINLYPVSYEPEVFYYWADGNGGYQGVYCKFSDPFINTSAYILGDGEFIALQKNIALNQNIPCPLTEGGITILLGDYTITKGDYSVSLLPGVTVYTDKQTDIFSAATEGYSIYELTTETGYAYTCGNYVAKVNNDLFKTFPEAATAAAGTKVITLLANIPESYELTSGTLRVEKGAYDVTITAPEGYELVYTISGVVSIYSLKAVADMAKIDEGYYYIKNNGNDKYVNVKGRRTATIDADKNAGAGTIIKVKTNQDGQVQVLRSQAVDIPYYAQRAMTYVPEFVDLLVQKFGAEGSGQVLGTQGVDAIMQKFNESFDYHLYVEKAGEGYRIYGRTPSMKPVIEFYQENKASVDAKLPQIESFVNDAIAKVVNKAGMGSSLLNSFKLETIWQQMGGTLTKPTDEASKLQFLQEVLANETNVWNFAYKTVTYYLDQVKDKIQDKIAGTELAGQLPADLNKYFDLVEKIRPGFKYYIVQKDGKFDIVSQGNTDINANAARTIWTLEPAQTMALKVPEANSRIVGATFDENGKRTGFEKGYYTTLYTDFAYQLPEGAVALKVTEIKDAMLGDEPLTYESGDATLTLGLLVTEEIGQEVPAQTPVLIMSKSAGDINITIGDSFGASADVSKNILRGADYLINEYEINTPMLESLYSFANEKVSGLDKYEHLIRKNSGTVNNKYFFSLTMQEIQDAYKAKTGNEMKTSPILTLSKQEGKKLAFNESWENIQPNSVILVSEQTKPALFTLTGDVTRDGEINVQDVTGQTNIIQFRDKQEYNYDYEAADVIYIEGTDIEVSDVTGEVNIIQKRTKHPDLP